MLRDDRADVNNTLVVWLVSGAVDLDTSDGAVTAAGILDGVLHLGKFGREIFAVGQKLDITGKDVIIDEVALLVVDL